MDVKSRPSPGDSCHFVFIPPNTSKSNCQDMASSLKNLSDYDPKRVPSAEDMRFGIVVSEWNNNVTDDLLKGAVESLIKHGAKNSNIEIFHVPGSFELIAGAKMMLKKYNPDAIICLGSVIRGDTPHFDYVCEGTTHGIAELNIRYDIPFIFGLLTTDNLQQAIDRCGGRLGNKGTECAITAIKMVALNKL